MLYTLLNWLYILVTCYICGSFVLARFLKGKASFGGSLICGIAVLTAYAEYFSLFAGVGITANIVLVIACLAFVFIDRKRYGETVAGLKPGKSVSLPLMIVMIIVSLCIILITAIFASASAFTYDTGTYHAQSIHWIESFGVVKGLAHMQTRLGFNNSYFSLCALFSFHFLGRSMHALSGFLAAFVMLYCFFGYASHFKRNEEGKLKIGGIRVSDFVRIAPFAYFAITATEITSPSTDYGVIFMIIWLMIRWVECIEDDRTGVENSDRVSVFSLLSVFSVFLITVKLSVGVLALITVCPLVYLIREKKYKDIVKYLAAGLALTLPFFVRNYYITGWLVYPVPGIDLFDPDWKVPLDGVRHEADEIVVWARYTKDTALIDQSIREWFPVWWQEQGAANRLLSKSAFIGSLLILLRLIVSLARVLFLRTKAGSKDENKDNNIDEQEYIFPGCVLLVSFLFFMLSAPSNRFGYAYILLIPLFAVGDWCLNLIPSLISLTFGKKLMPVRVLLGALLFIITLAGFLRGLRLLASDDKAYLSNTPLSEFMTVPRDYPQAECLSEEWEGMTIYYPVNEGDQIWYDAFPAILYRGNLDGTQRRGESIRDGFRLK